MASSLAGVTMAPSKVRALVVAIVMTMALALVGSGTFNVAPAHASFFNFCSGVYLNSYPTDRCAHSVSRQYSYTRSSTVVTSPVCAVMKTDPGGFGGNSSAPACDTTTAWVYSYCGSPYSCVGYPTVTDNGLTSPYQFFGSANF